MTMANGFPYEQYQKTNHTLRSINNHDNNTIKSKKKPIKHWEHLNKKAYKGGKK